MALESEDPTDRNTAAPIAETLPTEDPPRVRTADSLDPQRRALLEVARSDAAFDGWTLGMLVAAGAHLAEPVDADRVRLLFPQGVRDALAFWSAEEDAALEAAWAEASLRPTRIRDKVTWLLRQRIEALAPHREAARRAAGTLALPQNAVTATRLIWNTADTIWRTLGDTSLDSNYYSKRATLSTVYGSTLSRWFADEGEGLDEPYQDTWTFLDRRIDGIMQIEKIKGSLAKVPFDPSAIAGALGRLRYPRAR